MIKKVFQNNLNIKMMWSILVLAWHYTNNVTIYCEKQIIVYLFKQIHTGCFRQNNLDSRMAHRPFLSTKEPFFLINTFFLLKTVSCLILHFVLCYYILLNNNLQQQMSFQLTHTLKYISTKILYGQNIDFLYIYFSYGHFEITRTRSLIDIENQLTCAKFGEVDFRKNLRCQFEIK